VRAGGKVNVVTFELDGRRFHAFNGGPQFTFNEAFSMFVDCETQDDVDELWAKLTAGGSESRCGWTRDKFGWWQVIPRALTQLMSDPNPAKAQAVVQAMLKRTRSSSRTSRRHTAKVEPRFGPDLVSIRAGTSADSSR